MNMKQLLTKDRVKVGVQASTWQDAVRAVGRVLADSGGVEERYIDGMIRTTEELGPYIVIAPGLAIPHARPEDGVISPCMAVVSLAVPIPFGNEDNDPVKVLVALGATDHEIHVEALSQMADILSEPENLEALKKAESVEQILKIMWGNVT
jgi:mannitol/fructose-specific phosphotransferase system IIA component (Ntr-type)